MGKKKKNNSACSILNASDQFIALTSHFVHNGQENILYRIIMVSGKKKSTAH